MPPVFSPVILSRGRRLIMPALVFLICSQLFLLQILFTLVTSDHNQTVKQDANQSAALATFSDNLNEPGQMNSDPIQTSTNRPGANITPVEEALHTVSSVPLVPREEILRSVPAAGKKVALTFDDGPSFRYTSDYLRVLRENQVPATFFLVGRNVQRNPSLAALIAGEGHEIGNHTYDHPNLKRQKAGAIQEQILRTSNLLTQWTQQEIKLVRPPGGNFGPGLIKVASKKNLRVVMWAIDPGDWKKNKTSNEIIACVKKNLEPGAIILLHEGKPQTLAALPTLINDLRKDGWEFVTISGLIGGVNEST